MDYYSERFAQGSWIFGWDSAVLFGPKNRNDYILAPQYLNIEWHGHGVVRLGSSGWLMSSPTTLTIGVMPVVHGPESLWVGTALGGGFIFWRDQAHWAITLRGQGGLGVIDSTDALDAQGQDFTVTAIASIGIEYRLTDSLTLTAGVYYQHLSNSNMSEPERPNVGLDSVGPSIGLHYSF